MIGGLYVAFSEIVRDHVERKNRFDDHAFGRHRRSGSERYAACPAAKAEGLVIAHPFNSGGAVIADYGLHTARRPSPVLALIKSRSNSASAGHPSRVTGWMRPRTMPRRAPSSPRGGAFLCWRGTTEGRRACMFIEGYRHGRNRAIVYMVGGYRTGLVRRDRCLGAGRLRAAQILKAEGVRA